MVKSSSRRPHERKPRKPHTATRLPRVPGKALAYRTGLGVAHFFATRVYEGNRLDSSFIDAERITMTPEEYATAPLKNTGTAIQDLLERVAALEKQVSSIKTDMHNVTAFLIGHSSS